MNDYEKLGRIVIERRLNPHTKDYEKWSELVELELILIQKLEKEHKEQHEERI